MTLFRSPIRRRPAGPHEPTRVYLSSTYEDLRDCRMAVRAALSRLVVEQTSMEDYVADSRSPLSRCIADVRRCDIYIGIFAWRYGFVPPGENMSITEAEYVAAAAADRHCLIFLLDEDAPWPRRYVDREPDTSRIETLRSRLAERHVCSFFSTPDELAAKVTAAVARIVLTAR